MGRKFKDLSGMVFGELTAIEPINEITGDHKSWKCLCSCGNFVVKQGSALIKNRKPSCGCKDRRYLTRKDITARRFGGIVAIENIGDVGDSKWKFSCDCGEIFVAKIAYVTEKHREHCPKCHALHKRQEMLISRANKYKMPIAVFDQDVNNLDIEILSKFLTIGGRDLCNLEGDSVHLNCLANGYKKVQFANGRLHEHILVWMIANKRSPTGVIDHINHDRLDNRPENLRDVTHVENTRNSKLSTANTSGTTGVYWDKSRKLWIASIKVNYKSISLGRYADIEDAIAARSVANKLFGFHENHGKG